MHASEGIQDPLARVSEDPDEALECFEWLLAVVEQLVGVRLPQVQNKAREGKLEILRGAWQEHDIGGKAVLAEENRTSAI